MAHTRAGDVIMLAALMFIRKDLSISSVLCEVIYMIYIEDSIDPQTIAECLANMA